MHVHLRIRKRLVHPWSPLLRSCSVRLSRNCSIVRERVLSIRLHLHPRCQQSFSTFWKQQCRPTNHSQLLLWSCKQIHLLSNMIYITNLKHYFHCIIFLPKTHKYLKDKEFCLEIYKFVFSCFKFKKVLKTQSFYTR